MPNPLPQFQSFLDEHRAPVLAFLRAMVGPDDADDCFQETFMAAMRAYHRLDGQHPRAWVMTIARRKAIDHHRAAKRRPEPREELPEQATEGGFDDPDPDGLWARVAALPPKQRMAVGLRFAADLAYAEIAKALECSEEAARRSVHEGLKRLRSGLGTPQTEAA
jgi:RNA polymerase sigma factor (sigma-70 family)